MEHSNTVVLRDINEVYAKIECEPSIAYELRDVFMFRVPGAEFSPKFRAKLWDGKIYLFNPINKLLYRGHIETVRQFCEDRGYGFEYDVQPESTFTRETADSFVKALKPKFEPTEHQMVAFTSAVQNRRRVLLSPTASGKSLIIYMLMRFHLLSDRKGLIIVPKVQLVEQLFSDFKEYSELNNWKAENYIHRIYSGKDKDNPSAKVYISTWQSLFEMPKKYFDQFDYVINDECVHPDTLISMGDGTQKKIKDIRPGESVKTYNETNQKIENKNVIKVHENISLHEQLYEIQTSSGQILKITGNHKVLLTSGVWKRVDLLEVGDIINSLE